MDKPISKDPGFKGAGDQEEKRQSHAKAISSILGEIDADVGSIEEAVGAVAAVGKRASRRAHGNAVNELIKSVPPANASQEETPKQGKRASI